MIKQEYDITLNVDLRTFDIDKKFEELEEKLFTGSILLQDSYETKEGIETGSDFIAAWFKNGLLHKEDSAAIISEFKEMVFKDFYVNGTKYGTTEQYIFSYVTEGLVHLPDELLLRQYEKDGIEFFEFLREDSIITIPNIKELISKYSEKEYNNMISIFNIISGHVSSFNEFETDFWPKFMSGEIEPENKLVKIIEEYYDKEIEKKEPQENENQTLDELFSGL